MSQPHADPRCSSHVAKGRGAANRDGKPAKRASEGGRQRHNHDDGGRRKLNQFWSPWGGRNSYHLHLADTASSETILDATTQRLGGVENAPDRA